MSVEQVGLSATAAGDNWAGLAKEDRFSGSYHADVFVRSDPTVNVQITPPFIDPLASVEGKNPQFDPTANVHITPTPSATPVSREGEGLIIDPNLMDVQRPYPFQFGDWWFVAVKETDGTINFYSV